MTEITETVTEEQSKEELDTLTRGKNLLFSVIAMGLVILIVLAMTAIGMGLFSYILGCIVTIFGYFGATGFGGLVRS